MPFIAYQCRVRLHARSADAFPRMVHNFPHCVGRVGISQESILGPVLILFVIRSESSTFGPYKPLILVHGSCAYRPVANSIAPLSTFTQNNGVFSMITRSAKCGPGQWCCFFLIHFGILEKISDVFRTRRLPLRCPEYDRHIKPLCVIYVSN